MIDGKHTKSRVTGKPNPRALVTGKLGSYGAAKRELLLDAELGGC
jgi:hypothetical protein